MANVTLNVTDNKGQAAGSIEAPADFFGFSAEEVQAHVPMIHQVVVAQLAAARQGTHAVKNRAKVSGGGRKPWKQKGTGCARQGSIRAPQWYHGGVVHGPVPRDYSQRTPKKMKAAALKYVLSDRVNNGRVAVVDFGITEPSTKAALAALNPIVADNFTLKYVGTTPPVGITDVAEVGAAWSCCPSSPISSTPTTWLPRSTWCSRRKATKRSSRRRSRQKRRPDFHGRSSQASS